MSDPTGLSNEGLLIALTDAHSSFIRQREKADIASERWAESEPEFRDIRSDLMERAEERADEAQNRYIAVKDEILRRMTK
jgi:hypothetical protein